MADRRNARTLAYVGGAFAALMFLLVVFALVFRGCHEPDRPVVNQPLSVLPTPVMPAPAG